MGAAPILGLTTTGRKSGPPRTVPLLDLEDGGRLTIVASDAGPAPHPVGFFNLQANPQVELPVRSPRFSATARQARTGEKAQRWPRLVAIEPAWADDQKCTTRDIRVVIASPR